jgi:hypothetical protein
LAEARIGLLSKCHRRPNNQGNKRIASVHDDILFNYS